MMTSSSDWARKIMEYKGTTEYVAVVVTILLVLEILEAVMGK